MHVARSRNSQKQFQKKCFSKNEHILECYQLPGYGFNLDSKPFVFRETTDTQTRMRMQLEYEHFGGPIDNGEFGNAYDKFDFDTVFAAIIVRVQLYADALAQQRKTKGIICVYVLSLTFRKKSVEFASTQNRARYTKSKIFKNFVRNKKFRVCTYA